MSVTFYLRSGETRYPACPTCGGTMNHRVEPNRECPDPTCGGYGPDPIKNTLELNVTNTNAHWILEELLGGNVPDHGLYGELEPAKVLAALLVPNALAPEMQRLEVTDGTVSVRPGTFPEALDRTSHYVSALREIATLAVRRHELICFD